MRHRIDQLLAAIALAAVLLPSLAATGLAATCPRTSLAEIDDEVMCPICGTPLGAAGGPQAEDEREFIRARVEKCQSKEQIKAALVAEYGDQVLALPKRDGFNTAIYIVPAVLLVAAAGLLALTARSWRRDRAAATSPATSDDAPGADERLRSDMDEYDL